MQTFFQFYFLGILNTELTGKLLMQQNEILRLRPINHDNFDAVFFKTVIIIVYDLRTFLTLSQSETEDFFAKNELKTIKAISIKPDCIVFYAFKTKTPLSSDSLMHQLLILIAVTLGQMKSQVNQTRSLCEGHHVGHYPIGVKHS